MTNLVELIAAYAKQHGSVLAPDWVSSTISSLAIDDAAALALLTSEMGWQCSSSNSKPRAHHFPMLVFVEANGWAIAESWVNPDQIRLVTKNGVVDVDWSPSLTFWALDIPKSNAAHGGERAIDIFWSAILRRRSMIVDATIATIVINLIALATSIYSMQVYDRVIPRAGFATLIVLTAGMIFALLIDMVIRNTRAMMIDREAGNIDSEISEFFYARMQAVRLDARPQSVGTMAAQLRGTDQVRSLMSSASLFVIADLPFAFLFMGVMAWLGGVVAIVPLIAFPLALVLAAMMARFIREDTAAAQITGNRKNGQLVEALDAAETIKANSGGWHMLANWNRLNDEVHDHDILVRRWSTFSGSGFSLVQQLSYVGVVCVGAFQVASGNMTMGAVIACSILSGRVNGPLIASLPNLIVQWGYARSSLAALDGILTMPSDQPRNVAMVRQADIRGNLRFENVKFTHTGTRADISVPRFEISAGERVGIIGPVGSGKSTFLKLLAGLYAAREGHILLDGVDVRQIAEEDLRSQVCYFPQHYRLLTGSLRSNLNLGLPKQEDDVIIDAASKTGLIELLKNHPLGLDLPISEGGNGLSGGQRVQVGLTRLLLAKPKLLLLDEPTANLDQESEARILRAIIDNVDPSCALVLVTHKLQLLNLVNRLLFIKNGQIALDGPTHSVLEQLRPPIKTPNTAGPRIVVTEGSRA